LLVAETLPHRQPEDQRRRYALYAFQGLLIRARSLAYEIKSQELIALLDYAEYLPSLIARRSDETPHFRNMLEGLTEKHDCKNVLQRFDDPIPEKW
jgi:hypothetical protein